MSEKVLGFKKIKILKASFFDLVSVANFSYNSRNDVFFDGLCCKFPIAILFFLKRLFRGEEIYLAFCDGIPCGIAWVVSNHLASFYVLKKFKGFGIGTVFLNGILKNKQKGFWGETTNIYMKKVFVKTGMVFVKGRRYELKKAGQGIF